MESTENETRGTKRRSDREEVTGTKVCFGFDVRTESSGPFDKSPGTQLLFGRIVCVLFYKLEGIVCPFHV